MPPISHTGTMAVAVAAIISLLVTSSAQAMDGMPSKGIATGSQPGIKSTCWAVDVCLSSSTVKEFQEVVEETNEDAAGLGLLFDVQRLPKNFCVSETCCCEEPARFMVHTFKDTDEAAAQGRLGTSLVIAAGSCSVDAFHKLKSEELDCSLVEVPARQVAEATGKEATWRTYSEDAEYEGDFDYEEGTDRVTVNSRGHKRRLSSQQGAAFAFRNLRIWSDSAHAAGGPSVPSRHLTSFEGESANWLTTSGGYSGYGAPSDIAYYPNSIIDGDYGNYGYYDTPGYDYGYNYGYNYVSSPGYNYVSFPGYNYGYNPPGYNYGYSYGYNPGYEYGYNYGYSYGYSYAYDYGYGYDYGYDHGYNYGYGLYGGYGYDTGYTTVVVPGYYLTPGDQQCPVCPACSGSKPTGPAHCYCEFSQELLMWNLDGQACEGALRSKCSPDTSGKPVKLRCTDVEEYYTPSNAASQTQAAGTLSRFLFEDCPPAPACACTALTFDAADALRPAQKAACCEQLRVWAAKPYAGLQESTVSDFCANLVSSLATVKAFVQHNTWHSVCKAGTTSKLYVSPVVTAPGSGSGSGSGSNKGTGAGSSSDSDATNKDASVQPAGSDKGSAKANAGAGARAGKPGSGLSPGAIAGIVIGAVAGGVIGVGGTYYGMNKWRMGNARAYTRH